MRNESVSRSVVSNSLQPHEQAPLSMGFSRQEYWSGLPFPSTGDLPDPGIEPRYPVLQADSLLSEPPGTRSQIETTECLQGGVGNPTWNDSIRDQGSPTAQVGVQLRPRAELIQDGVSPRKGIRMTKVIGKLGMPAEQWLVRGTLVCGLVGGMDNRQSSELQFSYLFRICIIYCTISYLNFTNAETEASKHKLESRLPGEISILSDMQMTPPLRQKAKKN